MHASDMHHVLAQLPLNQFILVVPYEKS